MRIMTKRQIVRDIASQYRMNAPMKMDWAIQTLRRLEWLDKEKATVEKVEEIIGNTSWTRRDCTECCNNVREWVHLGQEESQDSQTVLLCFNCFKRAMKLFQEKSNGKGFK